MSSVVIAGNTSGSVTLSAPDVAGTTTLTLPSTSGTVVTTATSTGVSGSAISTGTVGVAYGGTGANSLTANNVLLGNGTSAVQFVAPSTNGNVLTSNGTTWTSAAAPSSVPTTAQVQSAMAGSNAGDLGTFNLGHTFGNSNITAGTNYAGSSITMSGLRTGNTAWADLLVVGAQGGATASGTWKAMANANYNGNVPHASIFLRVA